jgi:hypothetical protein
MNSNKKNRKGEGGQMMMLMVIIIASAALAAIAFSSFTVVSELKQVTDARLSGMALFAADTGIECILFKEFGNAPYGAGCPPCVGNCSTPEVELYSNGPVFSFNFVSRTINGPQETVVWRAVGKDPSGRATRALQITLRKLL